VKEKEEIVMGKSSIITSLVVSGLFVFGAGIENAQGQTADLIQPGDSLTHSGITIQNHFSSEGPIKATRFFLNPLDQTVWVWRRIEIEAGERGTILISEGAPANSILKLKILVKDTGRLLLKGEPGRTVKPLGQYQPNDPGSSSGVIVSGLGPGPTEAPDLTLSGEVNHRMNEQIVIEREHVVVRTTLSSSGAMIYLKAGNGTLLLADSNDIVRCSGGGSLKIMQY
jgi:hypothetical protein